MRSPGEVRTALAALLEARQPARRGKPAKARPAKRRYLCKSGRHFLLSRSGVCPFCSAERFGNERSNLSAGASRLSN
jgi:hypothetical protein